MRKISECYKQISTGKDIQKYSFRVRPTCCHISRKKKDGYIWKVILVNNSNEQIHQPELGYPEGMYLDNHYIRIKEQR